ncbi:hypothetical protein GCM10009579_73330 [Streptomyces javensis]|uniref:Tn3 transposase DDE domain-containing protein n=1 Tax=Streptomyces javensis TaxID=114698 RepID=A0ABP4I1B4_9ACTN
MNFHINNDIVFGLLTLAGVAYAPQLADPPDQKMWPIDRTADYGAFQDAARGRLGLWRRSDQPQRAAMPEPQTQSSKRCAAQRAYR